MPVHLFTDATRASLDNETQPVCEVEWWGPCASSISCMRYLLTAKRVAIKITSEN